jgi:hypothetical protein
MGTNGHQDPLSDIRAPQGRQSLDRDSAASKRNLLKAADGIRTHDLLHGK